MKPILTFLLLPLFILFSLWREVLGLAVVAGVVFYFMTEDVKVEGQFKYYAVENKDLQLGLTLQSSGVVSGHLHRYGSLHPLAGRWTGEDELAGNMESMSLAATRRPFIIKTGPDRLSLTLIPVANDTIGLDSQLEKYEMLPFDGTPTRLARNPVPGTSVEGEASSQMTGGADEDVERNPLLVGVWSNQTINSGGGFSMTTKKIWQIGGNGVLTEGPSRTLLGGSGVSADTGSGGGGSRAFWHTDGHVLFISNHSKGRWTPLGRYTVSQTSFMLIDESGRKQLWKRVE